MNARLINVSTSFRPTIKVNGSAQAITDFHKILIGLSQENEDYTIRDVEKAMSKAGYSFSMFDGVVVISKY